MSRIKDLTGQRFGRLIAEKHAGTSKHRTALWSCRCDCGNVLTVLSRSLVARKTQSCGCFMREVAGNNLKTHGLSRDGSGGISRLYKIWIGMKSRCFRNADTRYKEYGGRGITICPEWLEFPSFHKWATNNGYEEHLSIERKNVNGNYCPENCTWIPMSEQSKNTRHNRTIEHGGRKRTLTEWSKALGISPSTMHYRLCHWPIEMALSTRGRV